MLGQIFAEALLGENHWLQTLFFFLFPYGGIFEVRYCVYNRPMYSLEIQSGKTDETAITTRMIRFSGAENWTIAKYPFL